MPLSSCTVHGQLIPLIIRAGRMSLRLLIKCEKNTVGTGIATKLWPSLSTYCCTRTMQHENNEPMNYFFHCAVLVVQPLVLIKGKCTWMPWIEQRKANIMFNSRTLPPPQKGAGWNPEWAPCLAMPSSYLVWRVWHKQICLRQTVWCFFTTKKILLMFEHVTITVFALPVKQVSVLKI